MRLMTISSYFLFKSISAVVVNRRNVEHSSSKSSYSGYCWCPGKVQSFVQSAGQFSSIHYCNRCYLSVVCLSFCASVSVIGWNATSFVSLHIKRRFGYQVHVLILGFVQQFRYFKYFKVLCRVSEVPVESAVVWWYLAGFYIGSMYVLIVGG